MPQIEFEKATKVKLRFVSSGTSSIEIHPDKPLSPGSTSEITIKFKIKDSTDKK